MKLNKLIKTVRTIKGETQAEFGDRFDVGGTAVSLWESGDREAPYGVLEYCLNTTNIERVEVCLRCKGKGYLRLPVNAEQLAEGEDE